MALSSIIRGILGKNCSLKETLEQAAHGSGRATILGSVQNHFNVVPWDMV